MKFVRFGERGAERPGLVDSDGRIRSLAGLVPDIDAASLASGALAAVAAAVNPARLPLVPEGTRLGPCLGNVGNFLAIGLNYADHAAETGAELPAEPILFNKARSAISGPFDDVLLPPDSQKSDWEVEIAFVIGRRAFRIDEASALDHVGGYFVCNDVSERAYQLEHGGLWTKGKCYPTFAPIGPWLVTPDEAGDVQDLDLWLELNGERVQSSSTRTMIFPIATIVSYLSRFMVLEPGDIVTTGTPPGVGLGMEPQRYLKPGDLMRLGVERLGVQQQTVRRLQD